MENAVTFGTNPKSAKGCRPTAVMVRVTAYPHQYCKANPANTVAPNQWLFKNALKQSAFTRWAISHC